MAKQLVEAGERIGSLVFLDSVSPGIELPSLLSRLDTHVAGLREKGVTMPSMSSKWSPTGVLKW